MKNWLLVASFVLCCQFQNSTLAMMCEKIKVGFHYLNLTYSQTSYLGIHWSKKLEINIDYNIRLCLIFKASHLWDASRIWVNVTAEQEVSDCMNVGLPLHTPRHGHGVAVIHGIRSGTHTSPTSQSTP